MKKNMNKLEFLRWMVIFILLFIVITIILYRVREKFVEKFENKIVIPNNFQLEEYTQLFFDIFIKNGKLHMICPVYYGEVDISKLKVYNEDKELSLHKRMSKIELEPTDILVYDLNLNKNNYLIKVIFNGIKKEYNLKNDIPRRGAKIAVTTLFQDDYKLINIFYDYYIKQGVRDFYLYYNGKLNDEIKELYNKPGIILIEWNYKYWNDEKYPFQHHAQMGQIHDALYRFAKGRNEYILFCDLDEYVNLPDKGLLKLVSSRLDVGVFGFNNKWSNTIDRKIPDKFPSRFYTAEPNDFNDRSKCLYKTDAIELIGIHSPFKLIGNIVQKLDLSMYHFFNWTFIKRDHKTPILVETEKN